MSRIKRISDLLGPMRALAHIRRPGPSYADWHRFLEQCRAAGVAGIYGGSDARNRDFQGFATPLGWPLLRRWRWLRDCEERGLPFAEAEQLFRASIERDGNALASADQERAAALANVKAEIDADDILLHAGELGL
jgi:hypothetical protein